MLAKPLIFAEFDAGIMDSPYEGTRGGFASIVGLDYRTYPGALQIEKPMSKVSGQSGGSDVVQGAIKWFVNASPTTIYAFCDDDSAGKTRIIKSADTGATWSLAQTMGTTDSNFNANGAIWWKGYLLFASDKHLGYFNNTATYVLNWQNFYLGTDLGGIDTDWHPMHQGERDGSLYIGCGRYIALLTEVSGKTFDPTDNTTYSFTYNALDIPSDFRIKSLSEVGDFLNLGCWKRVGTDDYPVAVLYPWDYVLRPDAHDAPLFKNKILGVTAQLNVDNVLYSWLGSRGEIFYYNGSQFKKLKQISKNDGTNGIEVYPGSVKEFKDMPHFGVNNLPSYDIDGGIYQYGSHNIDKYPISLNIPYPLIHLDHENDDYTINSLGVCGANDEILLTGWTDSTSADGISKLNRSSRLATGAYFETLMIQLGTVKEKAQIAKFEIYLDGPLATGQAITIKWRRKASGSWTTVKYGTNTDTFSYAEEGAKSEIYIPYNINNIVNIQFRVEFTTTGNTTPILRSILIQ